jgi:hypothetical protein
MKAAAAGTMGKEKKKKKKKRIDIRGVIMRVNFCGMENKEGITSFQTNNTV